MKFKAVLWASAMLLMAAVPALSQRSAWTVTNMDLEKYRQQRLKAEKDYADNYARMGFPSPEELQKQIEKSRAEREELAARLAAERLRQEQIQAELTEAASAAQQNTYFNPNADGGYYGWPYGGYFYGGFPGRYRGPVRGGNGQPSFDYLNRQTPVRRAPAFRIIRR